MFFSKSREGFYALSRHLAVALATTAAVLFRRAGAVLAAGALGLAFTFFAHF
jgi:hypothetical protein